MLNPQNTSITDRCIFYYPNGSVKYLGVISDKWINMYEHITSVCRVAYYHHNKLFRTSADGWVSVLDG